MFLSPVVLPSLAVAGRRHLLSRGHSWFVAFLFLLAGTLVPVASAQGPTITSSPVANAVSGLSFSYTITASGSPTSFGADALLPDWSVDSATGVITGMPVGTGVFTLLLNATNAGGTGWKALTLTVLPPGTPLTPAVFPPVPVIGQQPESVTILRGSSHTLRVTANETMQTWGLFTYRWFKDDVFIASGMGCVIPNAQASDVGTYWVVVSNTNGSVTSNRVTVAVADRPTITSSPPPQTVALGSTTTFTVGASGTGLSYSWTKDGGPVSSRASVQGNRLVITGVQASDAGLYGVIVYNAVDSISTWTRLTTIIPPEIVQQPASRNLALGQSYQINFDTRGDLPMTHQWSKNGQPIAGATTGSLRFESVTMADAGDYQVTVANPSGSVTSQVARLRVGIGPTITTALQETQFLIGAPFSLSVAATGDAPLTYEWRKNFGPIAGATSSTLTLVNPQATDSGDYAVTVTNTWGSVTSSARITVTANPVNITLTGPFTKTYDGQPLTVSATTVPSGLPVEFSYFYASGNIAPGPPTTPGTYRVVARVLGNGYNSNTQADLRILPVMTTPVVRGLQQVYDGKPKIVRIAIPEGQPVRPEFINVPWPQDAGVYPFRLRLSDGTTLALDGPREYALVVEKVAQAITFAATPAALAVGAAFSVQATATSGLPVTVDVESGNATLNGAQLTLNDPAPVTLRATQAGDKNHHATTETLVLFATKQTQTIAFAALSDRLLSNTPVSLTASASSGLAVSFEIVGGPATMAGSTLVFTGYEGVVTVRAVQAGNASFNAAASVVRSFSVLTAQRPFITAQPVSRTVPLGEPVNFSIGATAPGPLEYVWMRNGTALGQSLPNGAVFTLNRVLQDNAGTYAVAVFHGSSCILTQPATLTVVVPPNPAAVLPEIRGITPAQALRVGDSVSLGIDDNSSFSFGIYQWFKDGQPIAGATNRSFNGFYRPLARYRFIATDAGSYHVTLTNAFGTATSPVTTLSVAPGYDPLKAPLMVDASPDAWPTVGGSATLSITALGDGLTYRWHKDGVPIAGATNASYTISNAQVADSGAYGVSVTNPLEYNDGFAYRVAVRTGTERGTPFSEVPPPGNPDGTGTTGVAPAITARPLDGYYDPGTRVVLSVTAEGTDPLSYQWRRGSSPIAGATDATLVFPSIQTSDADYYTVKVTNAFGLAEGTGRVQVYSGPLMPATPPAITSAPVAQSVVESATAIFTVDVTGSQPLSFQWRKNGQPLADGHQRVLTLTNVRLSDAGNYEVAIVNPFGAVTSVPVTLSVSPSIPDTQPVAGTWADRGIGGATPAGSATVANGVVTLRAAGADIWDVSDAFHFRYQALTGDGEIVARVTQLENTHAWAKAGVMIRESLEPGARNALVFVNASYIAMLQSRAATNGTTELGAAQWLSAPRWLRLVRAGTTVTGYQSDNGTTWVSLGTAQVALPATVYIGLAATSHANGTLTTALFDQVAITGTTTTPTTPVSGAPAAPTGLVATPLSSTAVSLRWVDASSNETGFELQRSTDGVTFATVLTVGADVTTTGNSGLTAGTLYHYRIRAIRGPEASAYSAVATLTTQAATTPPSTPAGTWQTLDIGGVAAAGSASEAGGVITLMGSGSDIWESGDEFRFRYQAFTGDGEIVVRVTGLTNTHAWAKAGVMIREDLSASARNAFLGFTPNFGVVMQRRATAGAASETAGGGGSSSTTPRWLRLTRVGSTITGFQSTDGVAWTPVGTITLPLPSSVFIGLAVTSHNDGTLATATFDQLSLTGGTIPVVPPVTLAAPTNLAATASSSTTVALAWTDLAVTETGFEIERSTDNVSFSAAGTAAANTASATISGLAPQTTYYFRVRAVQGLVASLYSTAAPVTTPAAPPTSQPGSWSTQDIGPVATAGSASETGGVVTLRASGADIWDAADEFHFRYQALTGDGEIIARVTGLTNTNPWAKAGVMLRESLTPGSRHAFMCVAAEMGAAFQYRAATSSASQSVSGTPSSALPRWVRLLRAGNVITGYESTNGTTWTTVGSTTLAWGATVQVGLAATSHNDGTLTTATFDSIVVTAGTPPGTTTPVTPPISTVISAPSNLVATAISPTQIDLAWADNSDNETDFRLERSTDNLNFTLLPPSLTPRNATRCSETGLTAGTTYYYRIRALGTNNLLSGYSNIATATTTAAPPVSTAWSNGDVGAVGVAGSIETGTSSITIRGAGTDIWDGSDSFRFLYRALPGDCTVEAQVASFTAAHAWAKAGVMIRESLAPGARNVFLALTPGNGLGLQQRQLTDGATSFAPGPWGATVPYWVRLVRAGSQITSYVSPDGVTWTQLSVVTFPTGSALVGFAVTSHDNRQLATAVFNDPFIR